MKKIAITIKNRTNVNIVNNNNLEKRILNILLYSLGILALSYVLILGNITFNIVARQSLGMHTKTLSNEVGDLELKYLSMSNKVDLAMSTQMGFKETNAEYATRKSLGTLSLLSVK
jgi:hypothetical protein